MDVLNSDDSNDNITSLVLRVRKIVVAFNTSPVKAHKLKTAQTAAQRPVLAVVRDVKTRWLSLHTMLERFVAIYRDVLLLTLRGELNPERSATLDDEREFDDFITPDEVKVLASYVKALAPIAEFVNDIEGEKYVTLCAVPVPYLRCLRALVADANDDPATAALKLRLHESLTTRLGHIVQGPNLALAAAALSPAYGHLTFVTASVRKEMLDTLVDWASEFPASVAAGGVQIDIDEDSQKALMAATMKSLHSHFVKNPPARVAGDQLHIPDGDEAPRYDVLKFWRGATGALCNLQHPARLVLCVPASSAASERVFSSAGFIVDKQRSRLSEDNVIMLTTVRDYLKRMTDIECEAFFDRCANRLREAATQ